MEGIEKISQPEQPPHEGDFSIYEERAVLAENQLKEIDRLLKLLTDAKEEKQERLMRMKEEMGRNKLLPESLPLKTLIEGSRQDIAQIDKKIEELRNLRDQLIKSIGTQHDKHTATKKYLEKFKPKIEQ